MTFVFAGRWGPEGIIDRHGESQPSAIVTVFDGNGTTVSTLWTDRTKATTTANPFLPDAHGNVAFFAEPGPHFVAVTVGTVVTTLPVIEVPIDPGEVATSTNIADAVAAHSSAATGVHGVGASTVESVSGAQAKADAAAAAAAAHTDAGDALLIPLSQRGVVNGVATLGSDGKIPTAQVASIAISDYLGAVASQVAMLALTGQRGDYCTRTDGANVGTWIIIGDDPTQLADWLLLPTPAAAVLSVDGATGVVALPGDGAAGTATKRTLGSGAQQAVAGNDSRLSDSRPPTAHHASHEVGGGDALTTFTPLQPGIAPSRPFPSSRRRSRPHVVTTNPNGSSWTFAGTTDAASAINDTAGQLYGTACAKMVTNGAGAQASLRGLAQGTFDLTLNDVEVLLKFDDITHLSTTSPVTFYLGNSSLAANFQQTLYRVSSGTTFLSGEWFRLRFTCPAVASTGSPVRAAITDFQLSVWDDNTGNKVTVRVQEVNVVPKHPSFVGPAGLVTLCFDDAWASFLLNAFPKLAAYGMPATLFPINDQVDTTNHLTLAQLKQFQDLHDCEIAAHCDTLANHSTGFDALSDAQLQAAFVSMAEWARGNGFLSQSFAWPLGRYTAATCDTAAKYWSNGTITTFTPAETLPPENRYRIRRRTVNNTDTGAGLSALVDLAIAQGQWLIFCFHEVDDSPHGASYVGTSAFNTLIDYINTTGIAVMTLQDGLAALDSEPSTTNVPKASVPEVLIIALGDETTDITTGTAKVTFRMPFAMTLTGVRSNLATASSSGLPTVDIKEAGVSVLSTLLSIDATELTSVTAATPAVISDTSLADDALMTIDVTTAGTGAKGLKVTLIGTRIVP